MMPSSTKAEEGKKEKDNDDQSDEINEAVHELPPMRPLGDDF
jgi:hypothetical protein